MQSPLENWLKGVEPLPSRFYVNGVTDLVNADWSCWVALEQRSPLHLASKLKWPALADSRKSTRAFLDKAAKIVQGLEGGWLDREEQEWMRESGLVPPALCYPIYLITCENSTSEQIMYVGQTSVSGRFNGGHAAALKLHNPQYSKWTKWIYQCSVWLMQSRQYLCLEWIDPASTAYAVLNDVESQLIYDLQPVLNSAKRKKFAAKTPLCIHLQQMIPESRITDLFFYPPGTERQ